MAVTSIWAIKGRVNDVIRYARNPEKTVEKNRKKLAALHAIGDVVEYAADDIKTEQRAYVTGINCTEQTAVKKFNRTLNMYENKGTRVCYHGYQSFAENEVDAATAHEIGVKLAESLWGNRFQVLVATHCNTGHYHNHFVLCATSFVDGKKFDNNHEDYRRMREESDRLCKEYGLSVIKNPKESVKNYAEWKAEQNGEPTLRGAIREAIDIAIRGSTTKAQFLDAMDQMGFIIDQSGKYSKIKQVGNERFVRFKSLGEGYSVEEILERIYDNDRPVYPKIPEQESPGQIFDEENERVSDMGYIGVYRCYHKALTVTAERPHTNRRMYFLIRQDQSAKRLYMDQYELLYSHNLNSSSDVTAYKVEAMKNIDEYTKLRNDYRNALKRAQRSGNTDAVSQAKYNIELCTRKLSKLRREVTTCDEVLQRVDRVRENLLRIEQEKFRGKEGVDYEHISGRGGSGREDEPKRS